MILSTHGEYFFLLKKESTGFLSLRSVELCDGEVIWEDSLPPIHGIESGSRLFSEVFELLQWCGLVPEAVECDNVIEKLNQFEPGLGDDFERTDYESIHWKRLHGDSDPD